MFLLRNLWGGTLGKRLYAFAFLAIFAVASLAAATIHFAKNTEQAAEELYDQGFVNVANSMRLELLLEQHGRLVESMPAEVGRSKIKSMKEERNQIELKLVNLSSYLEKEGAGKFKPNILISLPGLFELGDRVEFYARNYAQDKAVEVAAEYSEVAAALRNLIRNYQEARAAAALSAFSRLLAAASSLNWWVGICALLAAILIGPVGLLTVRGVLLRLRHITGAMIALARNDTSVNVPSRQDTDEVGDIARTVQVFKQNAVQLLERERELAAINKRFDAALNNMVQGVCMFAADRRLIVCNQSYRTMYHLTSVLCQPGTPLDLINEYRKSLGNAAKPRAMPIVGETDDVELSDFLIEELEDGRVISINQKLIPGTGWVAVHEDVTERRRNEAQIAHWARHDMLTNLPNRLLLREHMENAVNRLKSAHGFVVFCLDLDRFKQVNDSLGHAIGDEVLKEVANRLRDCLGENDFVARLGGDEFAIVFNCPLDLKRSSELATDVIARLSQPYRVDGRHIVIGTSIGITHAPSDSSDPDQLLKNADMALYLAKGDGRGSYRFFQREMDLLLQERLTLQNDLRVAILKGEFELYFQPIVAVGTGLVEGYEALVRWNHPQKGIIMPGEFIPLAEETDLIFSLGEWVMRNACANATKWPKHLSVAVNLSPAQFKSGNIVQMALNALAASGLSPTQLELEITESVLVQDATGTRATLEQLRSLGIRISMDDFGTGYSSLSYLNSFPFDKIKIDRSFIQDIVSRVESRAIVRAVSSMARALNLKTVAEGVETVEQFNIVRAEGCDQAQGYYFGRPMKIEEARPFTIEPSQSGRIQKILIPEGEGTTRTIKQTLGEHEPQLTIPVLRRVQ